MNRTTLVLPILIVAVSLALTGTTAIAQMPSMPDIGKTATSANPTSPLNINSASKEQLASLPGIGPKYSDKIVSGRPYADKTDLVKKKVIPQSAYDKIKGLISVK